MKRCIIFDCDNTLFETLPLHWNKHVIALGKRGIKAEATWKAFVYSHNGTQNWQWLHDNHGLTTPMAEYLAEIDTWYLAQARTAPMRDGVAEVLALAAQHHMALAVASTARRITVEGTIRAHGLDDRLDVIVTGDDVKRTKPDPELYQTALTRLQDKFKTAIDPAYTVAIEDDPLGVQSAKDAGLRVIHRRLGNDQDWAPKADFRADTGDELVACVRAAFKL